MDHDTPIPGVDAFGRLSRKVAAEALGYTPGTLANWAVQGFGPRCHRTTKGGKVFYLASEVRAFALSTVSLAA